MTSLWFASPPLSLSSGYQSLIAPRPGVQRVVPWRHQSFHKPELFVQSRTQRPVQATRSTSSSTEVRDLEDRIREQLLNAEPPLPPSAYDTAWVAMVPAAGSPLAPRYPQSVDWILQNQRGDGSWGPGIPGDPSLRKDALSSTMACVLALRTWGVGDEHISRGLRFIAHNLSFVTDDKRDTPAGFSVIFPGMITRGLGMGLEIPLTPADIDTILRLRNTEIRCMACGSKAFMAYVAEGSGDLLDWDQAMAHQRKNGSFFNSPATTAAAAIHNYDGRALDYLDTLISNFGSSVPTVYPRNVYSRLRMVDTLERMGISRSFSSEIHNILEMTYRSWLAKDEEIMQDMTTCAMAFRLLRLHGYDIPSGELAQFSEESSFHESVPGHLNDTVALLELYKASQVQILEEELILENIGSWSAELLKQQLYANKISRCVDPAEVEHVLKFPLYTILDRLEHRRNIEHFKPGGFQMLKSAHRPYHADEEIVALAADGFHSSQAVYQQELQHLKSWVKEVKLDELEFARLMPLHTLFSAASTMFPSGLSEARLAWSKMCVLITAIDDLFDIVGSREELENLVKLIDLYSILTPHNKLNKSAWAEMVRAMMVEADWRITGHVPSMEEYMTAGLPSFKLGPVIAASAYLVGPELPEDVVRCPEYSELFLHLSICGRYLNDLRSYEREKEEGKVNSVLLLAPRYGGSIETAKREVKSATEASRRELLRLVVRDGGAVPRPCREVFWNMCKAIHLFYMDEDGYVTPKEMMHAANAVVLNPLRLPGEVDTLAVSNKPRHACLS
ncbi:Ent-pimara-8(14),15-diene synthase [Dichanthelium oligosanthes]|uniref:Ent-pimara-8(14),15-diene synthase n=1 Tax=Dichanthelium oligosanthes TaxID=888268 RepID=A0A1E5VBY6_9POAL|nr:Ent-pimara-8(14),15-diene synthase [Dichanthelium oligosanthes]